MMGVLDAIYDADRKRLEHELGCASHALEIGGGYGLPSGLMTAPVSVIEGIDVAVAASGASTHRLVRLADVDLISMTETIALKRSRRARVWLAGRARQPAYTS